MDVDSFYADFMVISGEELVYTRSILVGANQLLNSFETSKQKLAREIRLCMETWRGENPGMAIDNLVLTGAAPNIPELESYVSRTLNVEVKVKDSLANVKRAPKSAGSRIPGLQSVSLTPLVGMAAAPELLEFNLVPDAVRIRRTLVVKARSLTALGMLLMTALAALSALGMLRLYFKKQRLAVLRQQVVATSPRADRVKMWKEVSEVLEERRDLRFSAAALMAEIHRQATDKLDVSFDLIDMNVEDSRVVLRGTAADTGEVRALVKKLETSPLFENVREGETVRDRSGRYRFNLSCALERQS